MSDLEKQLLQEQLAWYRLQRHDFLNHWQVILGYLQLNKGEKALQYMQTALKGFEAEQKCAEMNHTTVSAIFLSLVMKLNTQGIITYVCLPEDFKTESFWQKSWQEEYGQVLYGYTRECLENVFKARSLESEEMWAELDFMTGTNSFSCQFCLCTEDDVLVEKELRF